MATALHPTRNDPGTSVHANLYPRALMTDLDFQDNRYPTIPQPQSRSSQRTSAMFNGPSDRSAWEASPSSANETYSARRAFDPYSQTTGPTWSPDSPTQLPAEHQHQPLTSSQYRKFSPDPQSFPQSYPNQQQFQPQPRQPELQPQHYQPELQRGALSYALPPGPARRVVERYSLDDNQPRAPSRGSGDLRPTGQDSPQDLSRSRSGTPLGAQSVTPQQASQAPSTPRSPTAPITGIGSGVNLSVPGYSSPIMPLSASPGYTPPVSPNLRAYPQQPTYITPPAAPSPINPVYTPNPPQPQEDVCVECAMRDQDMADVDVTSPGVWERDSDVQYEELLRREDDEKANGITTTDESRPRARGGKLTEQNLKLWLSVNPREPASRQQTLNNYIKAQRALLEAEAVAHAKAMQEAKQLDNRMRDAYSQLRRSAYDTGNSAAPVDDVGGVRIKPPKSPSSPANNHGRSHSREVTLLENGMIVEHVDVRKEEREARERRRREEKRARKSSRSSAIDVNSIMSAGTSYAPYTDSGLGVKPHSRYSQVSLPRPGSALTAPGGDIPTTYSQTSFSDFHSLKSASPRRTRFFGLRSMGSPWKSQDSLAPSGMSGSMVNMHLASNRDSIMPQYGHQPDFSAARQSQLWPPDIAPEEPLPLAEDKAKKKKKGLAKFWSIVTGSKGDGSSSRNASQSYERNMDDTPLAPPPPLSYLVDRRRGAHASTPSLSTSPKNGQTSPGMSPSTAPSSILPSPASSRPSGYELNMGIEIKYNGSPYEEQDVIQRNDDTVGKTQNPIARNLHLMTSEPDMRNRLSQAITSPIPPVPQLPNNPQQPQQTPAVPSLSREKSLPPLPGEPRPRTMTTIIDNRPRTVYSFDPRQLPPGTSPPHDFLPPNAAYRDNRRQSFGGISARPNFTQNMPPNPKLPGSDPRQSLAPRYDEFGLSRKSLTPEQDLVRPSTMPSSSSSRRKSRFGFSSLLGKKHDPEVQDSTLYPPNGRNGSDGPDDHTANGHATSTSRHSGMSNGNPTARHSVVGRKPLEELVAQDPEFVAYRYPSNDQRLDLLR